MKNLMRSQFGHPHGILGHLVGWAMSIENKERNEWVVKQLPVRKDSRVLEIGFGPGVALSCLAQRVEEGEIVGVDSSAIMVAQASHRNADNIRKGRVRLIHGTVEEMTDDDGLFDVIFSVNTLGRHQELTEGLNRLQAKLKPGGTLVIAHQSPTKQSIEQLESYRRDIHRAMAAVGFADFQILQKEMKRQPICLIMGRTPAKVDSSESTLKAKEGSVVE
ncbi:MAG: class I SAM-dependent methyltransferase [bacterium]